MRLAAIAMTGLMLASVAAAQPDDAHRELAQRMASRAVAYLRTQQDEATGGWSVPSSRGPAIPAITALVVTGLVTAGELDARDPAVARGVAYVLSFRQPSGAIYDRILPSYNTALALSMLARIDTPEARAAIGPAQQFLRSIQFSEDSLVAGPEAGETRRVTRADPSYGGIGYGEHGRPDLSNLAMALAALHDSGVPREDPAFQRAIVFLRRVQMLDEVNDMPYADGSHQGGFIYATSPSRDRQGEGESKAGLIEETMDDGTRVSRLRAYGSMTYAGFKSYLYAGLTRDDPRVTAAMRWIREHYTLDENPGMGDEGLYYYLVVFARAMRAWGEPTIEVRAPGAELADERRWADDLIDRLASLQAEDGSFRSVNDRWMESNPVLITAYALVALGEAMD